VSARRLTRSLALAVGALALFPPLADAGPWNRRAGGFYAKLGYNHLRATELATPAGEVVDIPAYVKDEATIYAEYGLSDRFTAVGDLIAYRWSEIEGFESAGGIGDLRVALQWQIGQRGSSVFALRGTVQAPTGDETKGDSLLPTGSGVWEGDVVASAGVSLWRGRGWAQAGVGPQFRGGGLRDGFVYDAQVGGRVFGPVLLLFNVRGVQPWDTTPGDASTTSPAGFGDGVTYLAWGPGLIVEVARGVALQLDVDGATHVRNIAKGPTVRFGLSVSR
jgi:hypothetical protein